MEDENGCGCEPENITIWLIAKIIEGLSVPRGLGLLGTAAAPLDTLRKRLGLFGYNGFSEIETALRKKIKDI
jgi:hypothetical protein